MYGNYNPATLPTSIDYSVLGFIAGIGVLTWFIIIACGILQLIGEWEVYKKAGRKGWEILIPGHKLFVKFEIAGLNPIWTLVIIFGALINIIPIIGTLIYIIGLIVICFWLNISVAKAFGKSGAFGVGLTLLPVVFYPILGLGNSQYNEAKKEE